MIQLTRGDMIQSDFAQDMSAKKPETNDLYQHYSLDKSTFKNDNFLLSNEGEKKKDMAKMFVNHTRTICTLETPGIYSFSVSSTHCRAKLTHSCHLPSASVHTKPMKI